MTSLTLPNPFRSLFDRREQARLAENALARQRAHDRGYSKGLHGEAVDFAYIAWTQKASRSFGWVTVTWIPDPVESQAVIKAFLDGYTLGRQERDQALMTNRENTHGSF